ncbi:MAG: tRNA-intron lyase [Candidatus Thermoplasmatota archaeon]|nr:tRNA-intron lyase [Candidatus Thermoplasmatota archaeon]
MASYMKNDRVLVDDKATASTLMNKGCFGTPLSGGYLDLTLVEAAYLMETGRLEVRRSRKGRTACLPELLGRGISDEPRFMEDFLVYRDLRNRGIVVAGSGSSFNTFPRGKRPGTGKADSWITVQRENDTVTPKGLWLEARSRENINLKCIAAVVDSDWDITYYHIRTSLQTEPGPNLTLDSDISEWSRIGIGSGGAILHGKELKDLHEHDFLGTPLGETLIISPEEDRMLAGDHGGPNDQKYRTYLDLRRRGWSVRTGFKYGAHFRAYTERRPDKHSTFLVHCVARDQNFTWEELSRPLRLSHSVRKRFLFSFEPSGMPEPHHTGAGPAYLEMGWVRP